MKQGRETTQEERVQIVKDCLASGKNYGEMALKYKVSYQQVRTWTLRFEEMGEAGTAQAQAVSGGNITYLMGAFRMRGIIGIPSLEELKETIAWEKRYLEMELLVLGEGSILIQASIQPRVCLNMQTKEFVSTKMKACRFLIFAKN